jgi:hypothetical protein
MRGRGSKLTFTRSRRLPGIAGAVAVVAASCAIVSWWPEGPNDALRRSHEAYERGNIGLALVWAREAVERGPEEREAREQLERVLKKVDGLPRPAASPRTSPTSMARLALQAGQAEQAAAGLTKLLAAGPDREASWLLSRALLQKGDLEGAAGALKQAAGFQAGDPTTPEPAPHVGANSCQACHAKIHGTQRASHHAGSLLTGPDLAAVPLPEQQFTDPDDPQVQYAFHREGESIGLEIKAGGNLHHNTIKYAIGSGDRGMSFIGFDERDRAHLMRISRFVHNTVTDLTPSIPRHAASKSEVMGRFLDTQGLTRCVECHVTKVVGLDGGEPRPLERGIGCEACHGPGQHHILSVKGRFPDLAIARPKLATAAQILQLCGRCHKPSPGDPVAPDDPAIIRQQALTMPLSRCYTASDGHLSCVTCHDPHRNAETSAVAYESTCLNCHSARETTGGGHAARPRVFRTVVCPVNAASRCLECHMPKVEIQDEHASYTDHHIRAHRTTAPAGG